MSSTRPRFCARCRVEIPAERVAALPETRVCVNCSAAIGGEFELSFTREDLSKAGSLKRNYGGVDRIQKRRKRIEKLETPEAPTTPGSTD